MKRLHFHIDLMKIRGISCCCNTAFHPVYKYCEFSGTSRIFSGTIRATAGMCRFLDGTSFCKTLLHSRCWKGRIWKRMAVFSSPKAFPKLESQPPFESFPSSLYFMARNTTHNSFISTPRSESCKYVYMSLEWAYITKKCLGSWVELDQQGV